MNYTDTDLMYISSDERKIINRILRLKERHPEDVKIIRPPEINDGCLYATIPVKWLKIAPPRTANMTEEQRQAMAARLLSNRQKKG